MLTVRADLLWIHIFSKIVFVICQYIHTHVNLICLSFVKISVNVNKHLVGDVIVLSTSNYWIQKCT